MAHQEQMNFVEGVKRRFPAFFEHVAVLEVGSYDVNGSVKQFFDSPLFYTGLDLAPGKGVDVVCAGHLFDYPVPYDTVISTECFEHDPMWYYTFKNMHRLCRQGGLVLFTCAGHQRHEHGTPRTTPQDSALATDYYENRYALDFETRFPLVQMFSHYCLETREADLYFFGVKR